MSVARKSSSGPALDTFLRQFQILEATQAQRACSCAHVAVANTLAVKDHAGVYFSQDDVASEPVDVTLTHPLEVTPLCLVLILDNFKLSVCLNVSDSVKEARDRNRNRLTFKLSVCWKLSVGHGVTLSSFIDGLPDDMHRN